MTDTTTLTIFDCDGVLIDSEIIAAHVISDMLTAEGYQISVEDVTIRFAGLTDEQALEIVEDESGLRLGAEFLAKVDAELDRRLESVPPIAGVAEALDRIEGPRCICSNSSSRRLQATLGVTGLYDRFKPYVYSAPEVAEGRCKPAPDVYLFAARAFGTAPRDCVVIEDSVAGVTAAAAAGMRVIGFTGGAHSWQGHGEALMDAGAETVVRRMRDLPAMLAAFAEWKGFE